MSYKKTYKHLHTGIVGVEKSDGYIHYERGGNREIVQEKIPRIFVENSSDWLPVKDVYSKNDIIKAIEKSTISKDTLSKTVLEKYLKLE